MLFMIALQAAEPSSDAKLDLAPIILANMRTTLLDPESARDLRICEPKLSPPKTYVVFYSYRAKNRMGGYTIGGFTTLYSEGKITGTLSIGETALSMTQNCPIYDANKLAAAMR